MIIRAGTAKSRCVESVFLNGVEANWVTAVHGPFYVGDKLERYGWIERYVSDSEGRRKDDVERVSGVVRVVWRKDAKRTLSS